MKTVSAKSNTQWAMFCFCTLSLFGLVTTQSHACDKRQVTRYTGPGPHYVADVPAETKLWLDEDMGEPLFMRVRVIDTCGAPVHGARVQLWHADHEGVHHEHRWRTSLTTAKDGTFSVTTVLPGYAGGIPKHIHFIVSHAQYEELITRLFFQADPMMHESDGDLAMTFEEVQRNGRKAWLGGYEFVLKKQ